MPTNPLLPKVKTPGKPSPFHPPRPFAVAPRGPKHLHLGQYPHRIGGFPWEPPPGFVSGKSHNSREEWPVYAAIALHLDDPHDPTQPPFTGSRVGAWSYQTPEVLASGMGGRIPGASVSDFQVKTPTGWIGLRLDTERWHIFAPPNQQLKDLYIKTHIRSVQKVVTIYSQDFIGDESGEAVMRVVALALRGIEYPNPIRAGTARRTRPRIVK